MRMTLSHFEAALLFALFTSIVLGVVTRKVVLGESGEKMVRDADDRDRLRYGLYCMACFVATLFGLGWLMWLGHR